MTARAQQDFVIDESRGNSPYVYSGGQITYADLYVGTGGTGPLTQTGGTFIANNFSVSNFDGSNGTCNLSGADSVLRAGSVMVGFLGGNATVNQGGGSLITGTL